MARDEMGKAMIDSTIELGMANKKTIPLVRNWCKHIKIIDKSAGMISEIYNLPTNQTICCPHTTNELTAANFKWIATDFIIDNCIDCTLHKEVSANNYGRGVIEEHKAKLAADKQKNEEEQQRKSKIKAEIETVLKAVPSVKKTTSLSILKLIQSLDDSQMIDLAPAKILEAAKLSPEFFSEAALDYLSIYFGQESGKILLEAADYITENGMQISKFTFENLMETLKNPLTLDRAAKILNQKLSDKELVEHDLIFEAILNNCDYDDSYGRRYLTEITYPNACALFSRLFHINIKTFNILLETKLKDNDKHSRINCCGFLRDLCAINPDMITPFTSLIIMSFEFFEDGYGSSADAAVREVLKSLYQHDAQIVIDHIDRSYEKISSPGKAEILKFYSRLLGTSLNFDISETDSSYIIQKLVTLLLIGISDEQLKEELLDTIKEISKKRPLEFLTHFDSLLGFLVTAHQDLAKLHWNINDLENTDKPALTFNPLIGKNFYEIDSLKMHAEKFINIAEDIIGNVIKGKPDDFYDKVLKIILNLDSKKEQILKTSLIGILRESLKDAVDISKLLPSIHSFLHDIDSESVRDAGMKYLVHVIDKHPQIVTQTFIDTVKIFLNDPVTIVRGRAIEAYGAIMRTLPENVAEKELDIIIDYTVDSYVFIHKEAAKLSYRLYPFLDESRLTKLIINLYNLQYYYFEEKKFDYCEDLTGYLLFITKKRPDDYAGVVNNVLVKNCNTKDFYCEQKAIRRLTSIAAESNKFESVWFPAAVNFLLHTFPDPYNQGMDERKTIFAMMYRIKPQVFEKNIKIFTSFLKDRINKSIFRDVKDGYSIMAFFCCYDNLKILTDHFSNAIPHNASVQYIHEFNDNVNVIADTELSAGSGKLEIEKLKNAKGI
ncbi:hypothetical protein [Flavobacterium humidisoli]|uniref:HEAT repeat-containing protein n=1 Tax=Flavobacterium humidisoli TaxID=2937442 RepID=A0ABY4LZ37_9FLAO|nr:hypothetical protein [Flavobacterium humidisoli]UPZ17808.1 hypothetical protein M0M44_10760 [Flavobacterium humidisoli]